MTSQSSASTSLERNGHRLLLITLLLMIGISPFIQQFPNLRWLLSFSLVLILLAAVKTVVNRKRQFQIALVLALLSVTTQVGSFIDESNTLKLVRFASTSVFMFWVCALLLRDIGRRSHTVTLGLILGAINVYLMSAIGFANIYALIEQLQPGSFTGLDGFTTETGSLIYFMYYSFVTLTTLGFGDVSPLTSYAMTVTYLQAIFGQLYLVILVSRLVGMYMGKVPAEKPPQPD